MWFFLFLGASTDCLALATPPDRTNDLLLLYGNGFMNQSYTVGLAVPSMEAIGAAVADNETPKPEPAE